MVTGVNEKSRKQAKSMARSEGVCAYVIGQVLTRVAEVKKTKNMSNLGNMSCTGRSIMSHPL